MDTPGVLWPKFDDAEIGFNLAVTGAIKEEVFDKVTATEILITRLQEQYPGSLAEKYNIVVEETDTALSLFDKIAKARGCLKSGGVTDTDKVVNMVLRDFKTGRLGAFTLEPAHKV